MAECTVWAQHDNNHEKIKSIHGGKKKLEGNVPKVWVTFFFFFPLFQIFFNALLITIQLFFTWKRKGTGL